MRIFIVASIKKVFDYVDSEFKAAQHIKSSGGAKRIPSVYCVIHMCVFLDTLLLAVILYSTFCRNEMDIVQLDTPPGSFLCGHD